MRSPARQRGRQVRRLLDGAHCQHQLPLRQLVRSDLVHVGDANVASLPETEEIAHAQVGDPKSFVDVHQFPAPEDYKELGTAKVAALEQLPSEVGSKISQLALMIDSFSLQHGMINDDETVGPAEG